MKKYAALLIPALLAGCAAEIVSSNPRQVIVRAGSAMIASAQTVAEAECKKQGRYARFSGRSGENTFVFDCIT